MSVFALPNINVLVLSYVEWLEQRRGKKRRAADDTTFQPVSCATVANYLNGLVSIVKFQLRHDIHLRDPLLDQLRNLRSQAESYSMTQKSFEKVHPEWCSWQELQVAREKCRAAFDQQPKTRKETGRLSASSARGVSARPVHHLSSAALFHRPSAGMGQDAGTRRQGAGWSI